MQTKNINFTYIGGKEQVEVNVQGTALPITYRMDESIDWVHINIESNVIDVTVDITYDYRDRQCKVSLFNANGNELQLLINQTGFDGIGIRCDKALVLYHSYFDLANYYNFYVTVYGGQTQDIVCPKLKKYIKQVWDNSEMYNDFIIQIPEGVQGTYKIKHSEYNNYKSYCKEKGIDFDETKVMRTVDIVQISTADTIGEMVVSVDGVQYTSNDSITLNIEKGARIPIDIISTKYTHQLSTTKYEIIDDKDVDISDTPSWILVSKDGTTISIVGIDKNNFEPRSCRLKLTNHTNSHQYMYINIKQESGV